MEKLPPNAWATGRPASRARVREGYDLRARPGGEPSGRRTRSDENVKGICGEPVRLTQRG